MSASAVREFCERHDVDYLVVDKMHFSEAYFRDENFYFEPFNTQVKRLIKERKKFVLSDVPDRYKLFESDGVFVIEEEVLRQL